jgi:hypothetical protein
VARSRAAGAKGPDRNAELFCLVARLAEMAELGKPNDADWQDFEDFDLATDLTPAQIVIRDLKPPSSP